MWTAVTENLPPVGKIVVVWEIYSSNLNCISHHEGGGIDVAYLQEDHQWVTSHGHFAFEDISHWCLLPSPNENTL